MKRIFSTFYIGILCILLPVCRAQAGSGYIVEQKNGEYILTLSEDLYREKGDALLELLEQETADPASSGAQDASASGSANTQDAPSPEPVSVNLADGEYSIELSMTGGSGKAAIVSPALLTVRDKKAWVRLTWSSSNYDYMVVGNEKYFNENTEGGNSEFEVPITALDTDMPVIADTLAMGAPHEIEYIFTFYSDSIGSKSQMPQEAANRVVAIALAIIIGGGILNHFVNKKRRV